MRAVPRFSHHHHKLFGSLISGFHLCASAGSTSRQRTLIIVRGSKLLKERSTSTFCPPGNPLKRDPSMGLPFQPRLSEMEGEWAPQQRREARGEKAGDSFVRVGIQDDLEDLGTLRGDGSDETRDE